MCHCVGARPHHRHRPLQQFNELGQFVPTGFANGIITRDRTASRPRLVQFNPAVDANEAFGLWKDRGVDGLAYQALMRDEW